MMIIKIDLMMPGGCKHLPLRSEFDFKIKLFVGLDLDLCIVFLTVTLPNAAAGDEFVLTVSVGMYVCPCPDLRKIEDDFAAMEATGAPPEGA